MKLVFLILIIKVTFFFSWIFKFYDQGVLF